MQKRTSKNTCQNFGQPNRAYSFLPPNVNNILDYGCGRFDNNEIFCKLNNIKWYGYDPYWRDATINTLSLSMFEMGQIDCIICSNVLNIIDDEQEVNRIIKYIYNYSNENTTIIFSCYRGKNNNIGEESKNDCWQRNEKGIVWKERFSKYFTILRKNGDVFVCKKK